MYTGVLNMKTNFNFDQYIASLKKNANGRKFKAIDLLTHRDPKTETLVEVMKLREKCVVLEWCQRPEMDLKKPEITARIAGGLSGGLREQSTKLGDLESLATGIQKRIDSGKLSKRMLRRDKGYLREIKEYLKEGKVWCILDGQNTINRVFSRFHPESKENFIEGKGNVISLPYESGDKKTYEQTIPTNIPFGKLDPAMQLGLLEEYKMDITYVYCDTEDAIIAYKQVFLFDNAGKHVGVQAEEYVRCDNMVGHFLNEFEKDFAKGGDCHPYKIFEQFLQDSGESANGFHAKDNRAISNVLLHWGAYLFAHPKTKHAENSGKYNTFTAGAGWSKQKLWLTDPNVEYTNSQETNLIDMLHGLCHAIDSLDGKLLRDYHQNLEDIGFDAETSHTFINKSSKKNICANFGLAVAVVEGEDHPVRSQRGNDKFKILDYEKFAHWYLFNEKIRFMKNRYMNVNLVGDDGKAISPPVNTTSYFHACRSTDSKETYRTRERFLYDDFIRDLDDLIKKGAVVRLGENFTQEEQCENILDQVLGTEG